jgi:hypothetical protein
MHDVVSFPAVQRGQGDISCGHGDAIHLYQLFVRQIENVSQLMLGFHFSPEEDLPHAIHAVQEMRPFDHTVYALLRHELVYADLRDLRRRSYARDLLALVDVHDRL